MPSPYPYGRGDIDPDTAKNRTTGRGHGGGGKRLDHALIGAGDLSARHPCAWPESLCVENPAFLGHDVAIPTADKTDF